MLDITPRDRPSTNEEQAERSHQLEVKKYFYEKATFWGLVAYVVINAFILCTMRRANDISGEALISVQRAFIFDSGMDLSSVPESPPAGSPPNLQAGVILHFDNSGASPATNVNTISNVCVRQGDIEKGFSYDDLDTAHTQVYTFVAPRSTVYSPVPIRPDLIDEVIALRRELFVWGTIKYLDIFRQPHIMQFCEKYVTSGKTKATGAITVYTEQCAQHNCADNACQKRWGYNDSIECENVESKPVQTSVPAPAPK